MDGLATKALDDLAEGDLQALMNAEPEGKLIEYKEQLALGKDSERKELLADVSSFANAAGGHLIFGIREQAGLPVAITPIQVSDVDAEKQRIENILRAGIAPRMSFSFRAVPMAPSGYVWVFQIPRSWAMPHMVTFQDHAKFYSRNSSGKYQLDVGELRAAFARSGDAAESIRCFRTERLASIVAGEGPVLLSDSPKLVLHMFPLSAAGTTTLTPIDLRPINGQNLLLQPPAAQSFGHRYNLDGILSATPPSSSGEVMAYLQFYRDGRVEAVRSGDLLGKVGQNPPTIAAMSLQVALIRVAERVLKLYKIAKVEAPIVVMATLVGVKGATITLDFLTHPYQGYDPIDRDVLVIPEVIFESLDEDVVSALRPIFDTIWNAAGWEGCAFYDDTGRMTAEMQAHFDARPNY
jgi:hypothetical protein